MGKRNNLNKHVDVTESLRRWCIVYLLSVDHMLLSVEWPNQIEQQQMLIEIFIYTQQCIDY